MKTYYHGRGRTPYVKTTVTIMGQDQIDTWQAMIEVSGRKAHELAGDLLLDAIIEARADPDVAELARENSRKRRRLRVVKEA